MVCPEARSRCFRCSEFPRASWPRVSSPGRSGPGWIFAPNALPSTVQASIAFTSVGRLQRAGGDVQRYGLEPARRFHYSPDRGFLLTRHGLDISARSVLVIAVQLLLPFVAGPAVAAVDWRLSHAPSACAQERGYGSILILVYAAFSTASWTVSGIRSMQGDLFRVALVDIALLAAVMAILTFASRQLGFSRADESPSFSADQRKDSSNGLPIATLLFVGHGGSLSSHLMLFHQIQLMVCASLARALRGAPGHGRVNRFQVFPQSSA